MIIFKKNLKFFSAGVLLSGFFWDTVRVGVQFHYCLDFFFHQGYPVKPLFHYCLDFSGLVFELLYCFIIVWIFF